MQVYDKLSGLYEKKYFMDHLDLEVQRCGRYRRPLAVLMVQFQYDYFMPDEDVRWSLGYSLFKQLGPILLATLRNVDMACRFEGDNAVAFLPETSADGAAIAAERIRNRVEVHEFMGREPDERVKVAVNIGVAVFPAHGATARELVESARQATARAREAGGNQVCVLPPPAEEGAAAPEAAPAQSDAPESWDGLAQEEKTRQG